MKKRKPKSKVVSMEQAILNPDLAGPGMADITKVENLEHWESQVVEWLFVRHRIRGNLRQALRERHLGMTGQEHVTIEAWNDGFPTYPVHFAASMIRRANEIPHGHLFCRFRETQLARKFDKTADEIGDEIDKPLALVIRWPQLIRSGEASGGMVLHNREPDLRVPGSRLVWSHTEPEYGMLTLQPLSLLIKEIDAAEGGAWRP